MGSTVALHFLQEVRAADIEQFLKDSETGRPKWDIMLPEDAEKTPELHFQQLLELAASAQFQMNWDRNNRTRDEVGECVGVCARARARVCGCVCCCCCHPCVYGPYVLSQVSLTTPTTGYHATQRRATSRHVAPGDSGVRVQPVSRAFRRVPSRQRNDAADSPCSYPHQSGGCHAVRQDVCCCC